MTITELCQSQVEMTKQLCRAGDFTNAKCVMDNFRGMGLDKSNKMVKATLNTFDNFEAHIKTLQG